MVRSISKNRLVRNIFTKLADAYDQVEPALTFGRGDAWRLRAVQQARLTKPHRILDACSGIGHMSRQLANSFGPQTHIVAVDFCPAMVAVAKQKLRVHHLHRRVEFKTENVEIMPFPDEFFDAVFLSFGLRFVSDIRTVLRECQRVLRRGRPLVVLELAAPRQPLRLPIQIYREFLFPFVGQWQTKLSRVLLHPLHDSLRHFPDADKLSRMLIRAGFDEVEYQRLGGGVATLHRAVKPGEAE
ncbi:MAG: ubiquinone/menaquinone biosynthesis methyltransferase [candidate division FCPU426 bacterium]